MTLHRAEIMLHRWSWMGSLHEQLAVSSKWNLNPKASNL